ncbi:MAG: hypothetical protein IJS90_05615 [Clostridia bacterium]|nr:hypothetical protein [Clostridia bacterium]
MKDEDTGDKLEMEKEENPEAEADESLSAGDEKDGPEEAREVRKPKRQVPDRQGLKVFGAVALLVILIAAAAAAISAHDKKTAENAVTEAGFFAISSDSVKDIGPYPGGAVVLTANDIEYIDRYGELITSNDHTFSSPVMAVSGKDLIVYDRGGYSVKIERSSAKYKQLDFDSPVSCADICSNGTYAYVLNAHEGYQSHLYVYSAKGKLRFEWGSSDYLICLTLSENGKYAAAGLISVENASYSARVVLFDFSRNEPVYDVEFTDKTVYDVEFVSSKKLAVMTDSGFYLLGGNGDRQTLDEYSVTELCHSDMMRNGLSATAINRFGNSGNVLAKIYPKGLKTYYEHSFSNELTSVCAGATNCAFVFGSEIEVYDHRDTLTGKISLQQSCNRCALSDNRIYVCVPSGIYSFNVNENYEVTT